MDTENNVCKDVTEKLFSTIDKFNNEHRKIKESGKYALIIPYNYKNGLTEYSFGCGLSHYLQSDLFEELQKCGKNILDFNLTECVINMFTKDDMKHILKCKSVWDLNITEALLNY